MQRDSASKFSPLTLLLHWTVALLIISLIIVGFYMDIAEVRSLYFWHKSFGVLVFFIALARIGWRSVNGWPEPAGSHAAWERFMARAVHWFLILATVAMPLSGFLMSSLGGKNVPFFGLELVASNPDPENPGKTLARNGALGGFFHEMHGLLAYVLVVAILLHVGGAVKHHLLDHDGTLRRMFGGRA